MSDTLHTTVSIPGYFPVAGIDREEYRDFIGQVLPRRLVELDLKNGNYPPGLILQDHTGAYQVFGHPGQMQYILPLVMMVRI